MTSKKLTSKRKRTIWGYIFIGPSILGFLLFFAIPIFFSLYISFTDWDMHGAAEFIGFRNYINMFALAHSLVPQSLRVTLYYTILTVPSITIVSLFLGLLLNSKIRAISVYRTLYYIPSIVPAIAASALWMFLCNPMFGLLNAVLRMVGLPPSDWLHGTTTVVPTLALMAVWGAGNTVVIYLAGLQGIPSHLYEAVDIDGGGIFRKFIYITIPMLSPVIFFNMIMSIIGSMQVFTQAFVMTQGGPNNASLFYVVLIHRTAFLDMSMGLASAMAWLFFIMIAVLTVIAFKVSQFWVFYGEK